MASQYRTKRKKIVDAFVEELKTEINGTSPYNSNLFKVFNCKLYNR